MEKLVACWNHHQWNRLQSFSKSAFKIWLSKPRRLPRAVTNLLHFAPSERHWGFQRHLLWQVRPGLWTLLWSIKLILRSFSQVMQTWLEFANRERTCIKHAARRSVFNLWATTLSSKQLPSAQPWCYSAQPRFWLSAQNSWSSSRYPYGAIQVES